MKKKSLTIYVFVTLAVALIVNMLVYSGSKFLTAGWHHTDMTTPLDDMIPVIPWTVVIYVASFAFWLVCYLIVALGPADGRAAEPSGEPDSLGGYERDRFFAADVLARVVCLLFFFALPTTMTRPEVGSNDIWTAALSLIYMIDTPDALFPSIHCLVSWFCWIGLRGREDLPQALRHAVLVMAILICIATVTTKQHVVVDVFGGVLLAELCYLATSSDKIRSLYVRPMARLVDALEKKIR